MIFSVKTKGAGMGIYAGRGAGFSHAWRPGKWINRYKPLKICLAAVILIVFGLQGAFACFGPQTVNWTGNVNADWNNSANYDATPGNNDRIVIDPSNYTGTAASPVISSNSSFRPNKVEVYNGGNLTIAANLQLKAYILTESDFIVDGSGTAVNINSGNLNITYLGGHRDMNINNGGAFNAAGGSVNARNANVLAGSQLNLSGGQITLDADLALSASMSFTSGTLNLAGNYVNNGTYNHSGGTIVFNGSGAQTIDGASTFYNMTINNTGSGVTLNTGLHNLQGVLTLSNGTFNTNNALTILSNGTGTGSIAPITGGAINGTVTMQRALLSGPDGWRLLSSPVSGMTLSDWNDDFVTSGFTGSDYPSFPFYSIWTYDETKFGVYDTGFVHATNITNPIGSGQGFWCYIGPLPTTIDVSGNIISGAVNFNLTYTPNAGPANDGWNLVGNPYPSTIDWDSPNWTKTNMANAIYIWNPLNQQWASYVGGIGTNGGSNLIASSQGMLVQAVGASPSLVLQESCKSAVDAAFIRRSNSLPNSFSLAIEQNNTSDETVFRFDLHGSTGFDQELDAWKIFSNGNVPSLASVIQNSLDLSINTEPPLSTDYVIPLRAKTPNSGQCSISIQGLENMPANICITLEDIYTNLFTNLNTDSNYTFFLSDTTAYPRFLLHLSAPGLTEAGNTTCGQANGSAVGQGAGSGPWNYTWRDSTGNIIQQHLGYFTKDTLSGLTAGMYILTVDGNTNYCGGSVTDTFFISNTALLSLNADLLDAACYGDSDGVINLIISGGVPPYAILWQNGDTTATLNGLSAGVYSLTVTDQSACSETASFTINSPAEITASFTPSVDTAYISQGGNIYFINSSQGAASYYWDFGDGAFSTGSNPSHTYLYSGLYSVLLKAFNNQCADSSTREVTVLNAPGMDRLNSDASVEIRSDGKGIFLHPHLYTPEAFEIRLVNALGQQVFLDRMMLRDEVQKLHIAKLTPGMFTVVVSSRTIQCNQRVVILRN